MPRITTLLLLLPLQYVIVSFERCARPASKPPPLASTPPTPKTAVTLVVRDEGKGHWANNTEWTLGSGPSVRNMPRLLFKSQLHVGDGQKTPHRSGDTTGTSLTSADLESTLNRRSTCAKENACYEDHTDHSFRGLRCPLG